MGAAVTWEDILPAPAWTVLADMINKMLHNTMLGTLAAACGLSLSGLGAAVNWCAACGNQLQA